MRIIGGRHRGRRLTFPSLPGLRPTSDRARETLFNWLQPWLPGARCLDLFAGSGALGLEAASRGAGRVVMLERSSVAARQLQLHIQTLALEQVELHQADALNWLARPGEPFDILFLDPPFADDLLAQSCDLLRRHGWLAPGALIYLETDAARPLSVWPDDWVLLREKRAGEVCYYLCRNQNGADTGSLIES